MKRTVSNLVKELEEWIVEISKEPPSEINNLNNAIGIKGANRYGWITVANSKLREIQYTLGCLADSASEGVPIESIVPITIKLLEHQMIFTNCFGLTTTTQRLAKICRILPDIQSVDGYRQIVKRLRVYLGKLSQTGWIDTLLIHAAEMELTYDLMFPPPAE